MPSKGFTHLHLHSQYSLLDGAIRFEDLLERCKRYGMDAVACTDHGNMFGALEFYTKAKAAGIKPILGFEGYVAPDSRFEKQKASSKEASYHLLLLAQNNAGYKNLLKLTSAGFTEGFYYKPRVDKELLAQLSEGIIASSACLGGEIARLLCAGDEHGAKLAAESYAKIFPGRFYIEIMTHIGDDTHARPALIDLANKMGLPLLATNDAHFLDKEDHEAHDCLCCIGTGKLTDDDNRMRFSPSLYFKNTEEMYDAFCDVPEACENTVLLANQCNIELDLESRHAPVFRPPDKSTPEDFLTKLCYENAKDKYGDLTEEVTARIERELKVIESKGFSSYFLINWDFCAYAHKNNIPVGARGSGVGTIVGYLLGLCNVDPLKYDLLFERFMDPERNEMPDIDIDICQENRQKIIDYVREKYGYVAQIITMGTMKAKGVIRDVCRVKNIPLAEADRLAKLVPDTLGVTLDDAIGTEPDLKYAYENDAKVRQVLDICKKLEGLARHSSVHACGLVIAEEPLENFVPLYKAAGSDDIVTQFEGPNVEKAGLLKMDFLGLKTLSVLAKARELVKTRHGVNIDLDKIDIRDQAVFKIFASGKTKGIFQFESGGMQDMLMRMKPDRIEDLIAANALYRPGPMDLIPDYNARKHGQKWSTPHPVMDEILAETYGIMIYQEQVMRIANRLGEIPLREAYSMIKAISKKKLKTIAAAKVTFVEGCAAKGLSAKQAEEIFELIEKFAGYGFNKSHSTRYSYIAYQTAYFKAHYPIEFMAALITYENDTQKIVDYIGECQSMQIEVLPPDINESDVTFTPIYRKKRNSEESESVIRFGLGAVKGVGTKAVEKIIEARNKSGKFKSLFQFCETVDMHAANKQVLEALIKAGAFDHLHGHRAQMIAALESAMQAGSTMQSDKSSGQMNFFGQIEQTDYSKDHEKLPDISPWPEKQMLAFEKDVLGFYVTDNPLSHYAELIDVISTYDSASLASAPQDGQIAIAGMITKIRYHITKKGKNAGSKMAVFELEDLQGTAEVVLFPETLANYADRIIEDSVVLVTGTVDKKREKPNIFAKDIAPLESAAKSVAVKAKIRLNADDISEQKLKDIKTLCQAHRGKSDLYLTLVFPSANVTTLADKAFAVTPSLDFTKEIRKIVGEQNFILAR